MNRSFRVVWNTALGLWVVASEIAKGKTKSNTISSAKVSIKAQRVRKIAMALLTMGSAFASLPSWSDTLTSNNAGTDWSTAANWDSAGSGTPASNPPTSNDDVIIKGQSSQFVEVNDNSSASNLTVGVSGESGHLKVSGNTLTVSNSTTVNNARIEVAGGTLSTGSMTVHGVLSIGADGTVNVGTADPEDGTLTLETGGDLHIGEEGGAGTLNAGTVATASTGANRIIFNHTNTDYEFTSKITGAGQVQITAGTTIFTNTESDYSGNTTISGGTLEADAPEALSSNSDFIVNGGKLDLANNNQTLKSLAGNSSDAEIYLGTVGTTTLLLDQESNTNYKGKITGAGKLIKYGTGTLTLSGENTYSGGTTIAGGTLIGTTTSLQGDILNNASLIFDQSTDGSYAGSVSGTGKLTKSGTGTLTLSGENTYSGGTTISGGVLSIATKDNLGSGYLALGDGTLEVTGSTTLANAVNLVADAGKASTVSVASDKNVTASGTISGTGALIKSGAGTLTLSGINTYSGGTTIAGGTLIGTTTSLQGDIVDNASLIFDQNTDGSYAGNVSGTGALTKSGTGNVNLSGTNTYSGGTTISGGSLTGSTTSLQGDIVNNASLIFDQSTDGTYAGNITGDGNVVINSGTVSFANGTGGNSLMNKSTLSIADGETTVIGGDYTQDAGANLKIGASSLTSFGKLKVTDTASFAKDAKIDVDVNKTNSLAAGTMTKVVEAGTLNSDGFVVTDNSALFDFKASTDGNNINLTAVNNVAVSESVQNENFKSGRGAARVLDAFVRGDVTGTGMKEVVTALGKLSTDKQVSEAVAQTLPLMSGSMSQLSTGVMQANNNVVAVRQSGLSSGDGFISDKHGWVKLVGSWARQDSRNGVSGYDARTHGFIGGLDGDINDSTTVGIALSYMDTSVDGKGTNVTNKGDIDAYQVMFYGQRNLGETFHNLDLSWQAGAGINKTDGRRNLNFMGKRTKSDYTSYTGNLSVGLGRTFTINSDTSLAPSIRASYYYINDESYKEKGADALNLKVDGNTTDAFILSVQGDVNQRFSDSLALDAHVSAGYDAINDSASITSSFAGGGPAFKTKGLALSPWIMTAGVGLNYALDDATNVTVSYDVEGRSDFLSQTATAKLKWMF